MVGTIEDYEAEQTQVVEIFERIEEARVQLEVGGISAPPSWHSFILTSLSSWPLDSGYSRTHTRSTRNSGFVSSPLLVCFMLINVVEIVLGASRAVKNRGS